MKSVTPSVDWQVFWLLEAIFLGVPALVAVMAFRVDSTLSPHTIGNVLIIWIGLTVLNLVVGKVRAGRGSGSKS